MSHTNDTVAQVASDIADIIATDGNVTAQLARSAGDVIVTNKRVRDQVMLTAIDTPREGAGAWARIAAHLEGAQHVEALAVAALLHYLAGDTTRCDTTARHAHKLNRELKLPPHHLLNLLLTAVAVGAPSKTLARKLRAACGASHDSQTA